MEVMEAVRQQLSQEVGDDELSSLQLTTLKQKYGIMKANLSTDMDTLSLPEFLKAKELACHSENLHFRRGYWREQWKRNFSRARKQRQFQKKRS